MLPRAPLTGQSVFSFFMVVKDVPALGGDFQPLLVHLC